MEDGGSSSPLRETEDVRQREPDVTVRTSRTRIDRSSGCARASAEIPQLGISALPGNGQVSLQKSFGVALVS